MRSQGHPRKHTFGGLASLWERKIVTRMSYLDVGGGGGVLASSAGVLAGVALIVEVEGSTSGDGVALAGALLGVVRGKVSEALLEDQHVVVRRKKGMILQGNRRRC